MSPCLCQGGHDRARLCHEFLFSSLIHDLLFRILYCIQDLFGCKPIYQSCFPEKFCLIRRLHFLSGFQIMQTTINFMQ